VTNGANEIVRGQNAAGQTNRDWWTIHFILAKTDAETRRKWIDGSPTDGVADKDKESYLKFDDGTDFAKTLGLAWDLVSDQLLFSFTVLQ